VFGGRRTYCLEPVPPNNTSLDSSVQRILLHLDSGQFKWRLSNSILALRCFLPSNGTFHGLRAFKFLSNSLRRIVTSLILKLRFAFICLEDAKGLVLLKRTMRRSFKIVVLGVAPRFSGFHSYFTALAKHFLSSMIFSLSPLEQ